MTGSLLSYGAHSGKHSGRQNCSWTDCCAPTYNKHEWPRVATIVYIRMKRQVQCACTITNVSTLACIISLKALVEKIEWTGGRHFVDLIGVISWTKGVTSHGHFWRHLVDENVHKMSSFWVTFRGNFLV